jgi:D-alanyl-D-alanine carboxypeptidase/D-alanyl-D-alanine-endopeptidase (penicillin-binding protein 4)
MVSLLGCQAQSAEKSPTPVTSKAAQSPLKPPLKPLTSYATRSDEKLDSLLKGLHQASRLGGRLGISVISVGHNRTEVGLDDSSFYGPASCLKLLITAAAIDAFPVNASPKTTLELRGTLTGRTLVGSMRAVGGGDPNISDRFYPDPLSPLLDWADSLKKLGVDTLRGPLLTDENFFQGPRRPKSWSAHHFNTWYGAEVSALSYNDNCYLAMVGPGAKPGAPAVVSIIPDIGFVEVVNRVTTRADARRRVSFTLDPNTTRLTLTGSIGLRSEGARQYLPVRNPAAFFRAGFRTGKQVSCFSAT